MADRIETEICVVGGGPAGAAAALRLAQLGRQVCLLERAPVPRPHVGESLPASIWPILGLLGLSEQVRQAGFLYSGGSILHWAGSFERHGPGEGLAGLLVDRGRFDALLLDAAQSAGVRVLHAARAFRPVRACDGWGIPVRQPDGARHIRAGVLVDAAGRQAGLGRRFRPVSDPLLAMYAYWQAPPGFGTQTRVEAGASHWYWAAMLPGGVVNAMVFVDPARCTGLSPADRRDLYLNLLARSNLLSPLLEQRRVGPVRRTDATSLIETTPSAPDFLRVGEASFTVDPLSSQGVQMAMGQAVQAAAVVNTILLRPANTDLALAFYHDRRGERVRTHAALAAEFYARQHCVTPADFWSDRACSATPMADPETTQMPEGAPLRVSPAASVSVAGLQTATHIVPAKVLSHPGLLRPVANLEGIPLVPLVQCLTRPEQMHEIIALWSDLVDAEQARRILQWLWHNRILTL